MTTRGQQFSFLNSISPPTPPLNPSPYFSLWELFNLIFSIFIFVNFLWVKISNRCKNRENSVINPHVSIFQLKVTNILLSLFHSPLSFFSSSHHLLSPLMPSSTSMIPFFLIGVFWCNSQTCHLPLNIISTCILKKYIFFCYLYILTHHKLM